jgi:hypothetical protein
MGTWRWAWKRRVNTPWGGEGAQWGWQEQWTVVMAIEEVERQYQGKRWKRRRLVEGGVG